MYSNTKFVTLNLLQTNSNTLSKIFIVTCNYDVFDHKGRVVGEAVSASQQYIANKSAGHCPKQTKCAMYQIIFTREGIDAKAFAARTAARLRTFTEISPHTPAANQDFQSTLKFTSTEPLGKMMSTENLGATARLGSVV